MVAVGLVIVAATAALELASPSLGNAYQAGGLPLAAESSVAHSDIPTSYLRLYVDAVTQILDGNRESWGQGMFFTGGYEVKFDPIQHGGRNFLQLAKVIFEVDLSS